MQIQAQQTKQNQEKEKGWEDFIQKQKEKLIQLHKHFTGRVTGTTLDVIKKTGNRDGMSAFGMHTADAGSDSSDCDMALNFLSKDTNALKLINEAIERIDKGTYGFCIDSGEKIPRERLECLPYVNRTIESQKKIEQKNYHKHGRIEKRQSIKSLFSKTDREDKDLNTKE